MSEHGHATPEEQEEINRQEAYLKEENAPVERLVELGVLYIGLSADTKIRLLEASVKCEPEWVYNRQSLAWAYRDTGRFDEALMQIEKALDNIREPHSDWNPAVRHFEQMITGRMSSSSRLIADMADVQRGRSKR
jgi:hypothetical protein